jgi:hypothetical protein
VHLEVEHPSREPFCIVDNEVYAALIASLGPSHYLAPVVSRHKDARLYHCRWVDSKYVDGVDGPVYDTVSELIVHRTDAARLEPHSSLGPLLASVPCDLRGMGRGHPEPSDDRNDQAKGTACVHVGQSSST